MILIHLLQQNKIIPFIQISKNDKNSDNNYVIQNKALLSKLDKADIKASEYLLILRSIELRIVSKENKLCN